VNFQSSQAKQKQKKIPLNLIKSWDVTLCQTFSKEGIQLWEKYFAPHIDSASPSKNQGFQIPVSWFNFITLMLVTPK
jgi:hypothetical protein